MTEAKNKGGRPSEFTEENRKTILRSISRGEYLETAAAFAGLTGECVREWLRQGSKAVKAGEKGDEVTAKELPYLRFSVAVGLARAKAERKILRVIDMAGGPRNVVERRRGFREVLPQGTPASREKVMDENGEPVGDEILGPVRLEYDGTVERLEIDWRAWAWRLQHLIPERYSDKSTLELTMGETLTPAEQAYLDAKAAEEKEATPPPARATKVGKGTVAQAPPKEN